MSVIHNESLLFCLTNERWELDENDVLNMTFLIYPRAKQLKRDVSVLLKNHGEAIKLISIEAEKSLTTTFRCEIKLKLIMTEEDIDIYYKTILNLISLAGKVVCEGFSITKRVETKDGAADLVTEFDQRVEEILIKNLQEKFPTHKFIGEESTAIGIKTTFSDDPTWIIDPIDGTTNFVHGLPFVTISVALAINKQVVLGVIYNPIMNDLYSAIHGKGAFKNGRPIKCSKQTNLALSQILGEYGSSRDANILNVKCKNFQVIIAKVHSIRALGSAAMNLCLVAEGACDAYFEYGVHIWDYAAGDLIAREAGAYTCDPSATAQTLIIILGSVGGVVLIAVLIIIWCICRKCKQRSIISEMKKDQAHDQRMEERRAAAEVRSTERHQAADQLRMKYVRLIIKQCHNQWRSSLFRTVVVINQRQLATTAGKEKKASKSQENQTLVQSTTDNQIEVATFKEKAQQAAKDTGYSLIVIAGLATLGGLCYLVLHELYSRETPNGIYKEASKMCLANTEVQDALGTPILVHTTPQIGSMRINNVR
ncbi:unnamed protein product [Rotaria sp. Silwood2]|nr:unnamed protein product [Rotaria sp. Silwood2]